ncbi:hypothetical protein NP233_g4086 [Leucocoprinus birnbaumii]|uniref:Uncharacterized protein n=1 Tax=Leucocoprinus birnbaumii TaxID=56174 RepID=A0AAD5YS69_9AGAR|nr:hypothetical protein NP233_g4086 [Leucocoprinus birnbaumii]
MSMFSHAHDNVYNGGNFVSTDSLELTNKKLHIEKSFNANGDHNLITAPTFDELEKQTRVAGALSNTSITQPKLASIATSPERDLLLKIHGFLDEFLFPEKNQGLATVTTSSTESTDAGIAFSKTVIDTEVAATIVEDPAGNQVLQNIASKLGQLTIAARIAPASVVVPVSHPASGTTRQPSLNSMTSLESPSAISQWTGYRLLLSLSKGVLYAILLASIASVLFKLAVG